jgi:hypothetical protein
MSVRCRKICYEVCTCVNGWKACLSYPLEEVGARKIGIAAIDDEIWFICHLVSYEESRHYYHVMVVLDKNYYHLKS